MHKEQQVYNIERVFLGKVKTNELVANIIQKHSKNIDIYIEFNYEKPLKNP